MSMKTTVSVTQAQAQLPKLLRSKETVAVQRHDETVAYIVPRERMDALLETLEVLATPAAMQAIRRDLRGKSRYLPLSALDEDQG
jgi:PHD/YefM family antitoxin component YafN of YafNO toxin-antitoxin module